MLVQSLFKTHTSTSERSVRLSSLAAGHLGGTHTVHILAVSYVQALVVDALTLD